MKLRQMRISTAILPLVLGVCVSIQAQTGGESLPTLSGTKAIEYLKQNRQYDSLMEAFEATRKGQTDETPTEGAFGQTAKLTAADGAAGDNFGTSVAISGDTAIVGAYSDEVGANRAQGSVYVFVRSGTAWSQQQKLTASDGAAIDHFGISVAISGVTAIVGAYRDEVGANYGQGSAYIFVRSGTTWSEQQKLIAADGAANDQFGRSVAISGETAIIGSGLDDVGANTDQGSAYIFVRSGTIWSQQQKLTASDGAANDQFGTSVAISGETAIVGAFGDDVGGNLDQGSAYIFTRAGTTWSQQQKLTASDGSFDRNEFGYSVAISGDTAIVGAVGDNVGQQADQGSAYIFVRSGTTWSQQQKLTAPGAAGDAFGISVAISGDIAIIGAPGNDVGANTNQGSAYIFVRSGTMWSQQQKLTAADGAAIDNFGNSVAISGDTAIVGAVVDDVGANTDQGSAYVFRVPKAPFDFDGDGKTDAAVYRPSAGDWYLLRSTTGFGAFHFGSPSDIFVPADYTGDGKTDMAVFRPSEGIWYVLRSEDYTFYGAGFGTSGDIPSPGDFDADGKADTVVFRPSNGTWYLNRSTAGFNAVQFGQSGDVPAAGDFDGDGKNDISVYRPSLGNWYRLNSGNGTFYGVHFGLPGDMIVPADYTGDGKADNAVFRPSTSTWYVYRSEDNSFYGGAFGSPGDLPSPGDYDGDGKTDIAVWRPGAQSYFYIMGSTSGFQVIPWGIAEDRPVANAYVY